MASKTERALWAAKLNGTAAPRVNGSAGRGKAMPDVGRVIGHVEPFRGTVLGVDPSLRGTGLAIVRCEAGDRVCLLHSRTIRLKSSLSQADCLAELSRQVTEVVRAHSPDCVATEQTIYVQNVQTAMLLGAARGAIVAAAALEGLPVYDYPPLRIKQAVAGFGRASKEQLARTVRSLLSMDDQLRPDEADAAGAALCHVYSRRLAV